MKQSLSPSLSFSPTNLYLSAFCVIRVDNLNNTKFSYRLNVAGKTCGRNLKINFAHAIN